MNKKKSGDLLSRLSHMLQQPRQAFLAFSVVSLAVAGAGVAFKHFNNARPLSTSGFSEGPSTTLERPAEVQADPGIDSTDMATFGERPARTLKEVGQTAAETEQAQTQTEAKTPLTEFPTVDPLKLDLKGQSGGGSSAAAPALGGPFERLSSLAGRAFNSSKAFLRSFGGSSRQAGPGKSQASSITTPGQQILDKNAKNLGATTAVLPGPRGTPVTSQPGYPVAIGGTPITGAGAGQGQGPKDSKGSGGGSGGSSGGGGGSNSPTASTTTAGGTGTGGEDQFVVVTDDAGLQRQCFCVRPTGSELRPYEIMRPNFAPTMCSQVEYKVADEEAVFKQLLNCDEYKKCSEMMGSLDEKHRAQIKIKEELAAFDKKRADTYYTCWGTSIGSTVKNSTGTTQDSDEDSSTDESTETAETTETKDHDSTADVYKSSETIQAEQKVADKCKYDFLALIGIVSEGCLKAKQQLEDLKTPEQTNKKIVNGRLAEAEEKLNAAKTAKGKACRSTQQGPHGVGKLVDAKACKEAEAALADAQKKWDEAFIQMRAEEKAVNEMLANAEAERNAARTAKEKACRSAQQGPHGVGKPVDAQGCKEAADKLTAAQQKADGIKKERPSGCLEAWITPSECFYAWRDDVFGPKESVVKETPIQTVMAAEKQQEEAQRAKNTACATKGGRGSQTVINKDACDKAKGVLAAAEKKVKDVKKELYGCIVDAPWTSIVECSRITTDGAQAKLRGEDKIAYKSGDKTNESKTQDKGKESVGKEDKAAADKAVADGRYTDCRFLPRSPGDKELQYRCKEKATGKEVPVSNAVYAAYFRSQKDKDQKKEIVKEPDSSGSKSLTWSVRATLDFANSMIDDLRDVKKWPSSKLNKYNKDYDEKLRIKYDEQMKLANALKRNPGGSPADVAKAMKLQSDWSQFEREALRLRESPSKTVEQASTASSNSGGSNKTMTVVDQNGKKMDAKTSGQATSCSRSQGFMVVQKSGVSYCQQIPVGSKTLTKIDDSASNTGVKLVKYCPSGYIFKQNNWAGTGSGECVKETNNKVSNANRILEAYQQSRNTTQAINSSDNPKKCRKIVGTTCVP